MLRTISDIDLARGIIRLSDGTRWQVVASDRATISSWRLLSAIEVLETLSSTQLRNIDSGTAVSVKLCA